MIIPIEVLVKKAPILIKLGMYSYLRIVNTMATIFFLNFNTTPIIRQLVRIINDIGGQ